MEEDSAGLSTSQQANGNDPPRDGFTTVLEHALWEAERYPECSDLLIGRMFGVPSEQLRPCKVCCGISGKTGSPSYNPRNYTLQEIMTMTETCPAHAFDEEMEKIDAAYTRFETKLAKQARAEHARLAKELKKAELEEKKKLRENTKTNSKTNNKGKKGKKGKKVATTISDEEEPIDDEIEEDDANDSEYEPCSQPKKAKTVVIEEDIDYFMYEIEPKPKQKKVTRWTCPGCEKSSKYGSTGCCWCDEWWHFKCAGFKKAKDVPQGWTCKLCDIP
ncbi:hypothetical protein GCK72_023481 [Caenorhabditis remanei]|uniref:PHD-type domain-containing protein n=1 Tax=Caenorhabditis remanei TaxID=31234 RepID=A0A6A5FWU2_CAERE|nr:hypothetical protein GCK72_023481 [Caenorhabditis remanei]KAF1747023.1 hypothetical protein GCK72_023481 [Caenorhabditis remanei]